jgi:hypothetical protein
MWFMTQHKRWGLLKDDPDYLAVAKQVNQIDLYKDAAAMTKTPVPKTRCASKLMDGWSGTARTRSVRRLVQDQSLMTGGRHERHAQTDSAEPAAAATPAPPPRRRTPPAPPARRQRHRARTRTVSATGCLAPLMGRPAGAGLADHHREEQQLSRRRPPRWKKRSSCSDPFYRNGPNDQGIGWNVLARCSAWAWASAWRRWWAFRWAS